MRKVERDKKILCSPDRSVLVLLYGGRENSVLISAVSRMMQGLGVPCFVGRVEKKWTEQRK